MARHQTATPELAVETSSLSRLRGLLLECDRIALLSGHQAFHDERAGLLQTLPIDLQGTYRPIDFKIRRHTTPLPAARAFIAQLHNFTEEIRKRVSDRPFHRYPK